VSKASLAHDLLRLAVAIAEGRAADSLRRAAGRAAYMAVVAAIGACCALGAFVCMLVALWIYAKPHVGAAGAPVVVAGVLVLAGLCVFALMRYRAGSRPAPAAADRSAFRRRG
jgi:hypothetical protein